MRSFRSPNLQPTSDKNAPNRFKVWQQTNARLMVRTAGRKKVGMSWPSTVVTMPEDGSWSLRKWVYVVGLSIFGRSGFRADFNSGSHSRTLCIRLGGNRSRGRYNHLRQLSLSILRRRRTNSGR